MNIKSMIKKLKQIFCGSKQPQTVHTGTIKFFDRKKRFGFIVSGKNEYFFHAAATRPSDFKSLQDGVRVKFKVVQGKKGPQADKIELVR